MLDLESIKNRLQFNLKNLSSYIIKAQDIPSSRAAVLIGVFDYKEESYVVLTKRSEKLKTHKGEVCFPGGKEDFPGEGCVATALREAHEEIGLDPRHVTVLGNLAPMYTSTKMLVTPVIGIINDFENIQLKINTDEVSDIFACPIGLFLDSSLETRLEYTPPNTTEVLQVHNFFYKAAHLNDYDSVKPNGNFLSLVFSNPDQIEHRIYGLTAKFAIGAGVVFLNQAAVFGEIKYTPDQPQGNTMSKHFIWASFVSQL